MVFLINILPFLIVLVFGLAIVYAVPSKVGKVIMGAIGVLMLVVYFQIQPSYMPKGTVKPMQVQQFEKLDIPMVDRSLKPMSDEQRDAQRNKALQEIDNSINDKIKLNKE